MGYDPATNQTIIRENAYRAWLGTARLGLRFFVPRPYEQQWLFGFGVELNKMLAAASAEPLIASLDRHFQEEFYAFPTVLPNLGLGWRQRRLTLSLDGQLYAGHHRDSNPAFIFFGSNFALRAGAAYQLGRNPDEAQRRPAARP